MKYLITIMESDNIARFKSQDNKEGIIGREVVEANSVKNAIDKCYFKRMRFRYNYHAEEVDNKEEIGFRD